MTEKEKPATPPQQPTPLNGDYDARVADLVNGIIPTQDNPTGEISLVKQPMRSKTPTLDFFNEGR